MSGESSSPSPSRFTTLPPTKRRIPVWVWIAIGAAVLVLLGTVAIIVAALTVPQLIVVKKRANQVSAVQTMHTISAAEMTYYASYPDTGYACSLASLGGDPKAGPPSEQAAQLIDPELATTSQKNGYKFSVKCGSKVNADGHEVNVSFQLTGVPLDPGKTGDNGYCTDENAVIMVDPAGGTDCTKPLQ